ncbi:hypothetical protein PQ465_07245 [Sphingobacterium oryzagri]|uniref:Uncharacterized protein n=1 Tax=Sphingobacterium oryzagri TaxID=3025669 RepID=A0ABY7WPB6_9SPHI|nr:hypothetical protein [Sphingobacterium sp. KACC 22765]WDF70165.1 hypothetical protein PQ465_07245 [Sphingobacterium sp. KACC 22765]
MTMNFDIITLDDLQKEANVPKTVEDQAEETWFVKFGEEVVGVGLFLPSSDKCVLAIIGNSYEDKIVIGNYAPEHTDEALLREGLDIVFQGYLRSIKGDTVIGEMQVD